MLLIEAELFAAFCRRPAPDGRALLCAANYAREIQGITASRNLPDVRNRAPVTPVSLHISDVSAQRKVRGVKRGQETMFGVLPPFALRRGHGVSAAEGGNAHALRGRNLASSGAPLYRRKVCRHPTVKRKGRSSPPAARRRIGGTACRQQTVKRKKTSAEGIRKRLPFVKRAFFSCFTSAYAADFRNYSSTFT